MTTTAMMIIIAAVIVVAIAAWFIFRQQRSKKLHSKFGPEYEHAVREFGVCAHRALRSEVCVDDGLRDFAGRVFHPEFPDLLRCRSCKGDSCGFAGFCEGGILAEKSISGMDHRHSIGSLCVSSVIHALEGVGENTFNDVVGEVPSSEIDKTKLHGPGTPLVELLVQSALCPSKGQARKDIEGGGIYVNNVREAGATRAITVNDLLFGKHLLLRKGKRNYAVLTARS